MKKNHIGSHGWEVHIATEWRDKELKDQQYKYLKSIIKHHQKLYYVENAPIITDDLFDQLYRILNKAAEVRGEEPPVGSDLKESYYEIK